jgi:hypothetical protein
VRVMCDECEIHDCGIRKPCECKNPACACYEPTAPSTPAPQGQTDAESLEREFYAQARHDNIHWSGFCARKLQAERESRKQAEDKAFNAGWNAAIQDAENALRESGRPQGCIRTIHGLSKPVQEPAERERGK